MTRASWSEVKPPGCECDTIERARSCYERCDDILTEPEPPRMTREEFLVTWALLTGITITLIISLLVL